MTDCSLDNLYQVDFGMLTRQFQTHIKVHNNMVQISLFAILHYLQSVEMIAVRDKHFGMSLGEF